MLPIKVKPKTEQLLADYEAEYLHTRDIKVYQKMFSELLPYARSLILKKTKGKIFLPPALVEEAAIESTVKYMSQYEKPDFYTKVSFAGLMSLKVLESLYGPKTKAADKISSLNEHIENGKTTETELGDLSESYNFTYLFRPSNRDITDDPVNYLFDSNKDAMNNFMTVVKDLYKVLDVRSFYLIALAIAQFVDKSKTLEKFKEIFFSKEMYEIFDVSMLEARNRLSLEA